jgi:mycoredoxin
MAEATQTSSPSTASIVMYTTPWCGDCWRAKRLFAALRVPYTEVNVERDPQAANHVRQLNHGMQSVPTIIFPDGVRLTEPSHQALEAQLRRFMSSNDSTMAGSGETADPHKRAGEEFNR